MTAPVLHRARPGAMDADGTRPRAPQPARETDRSGVRVPGGPRARRFAAGLLAGVVVAGAIALAVGPGSPARPATTEPTPAPDAAEQAPVAAYSEAIAGPIAEGGAVVVYGMMPGVADIGDGAYADAVLIGMAEGWVAEMRRIRATLASVSVPAGLEPVAAALDDAFAGYLKTAETLLAAARTGGDERAALVGQAAAHGREADRIYDQATEALAAERARLGLAPDHDTGGPR